MLVDDIPGFYLAHKQEVDEAAMRRIKNKKRFETLSVSLGVTRMCPFHPLLARPHGKIIFLTDDLRVGMVVNHDHV